MKNRLYATSLASSVLAHSLVGLALWHALEPSQPRRKQIPVTLHEIKTIHKVNKMQQASQASTSFENHTVTTETATSIEASAGTDAPQSSVLSVILKRIDSALEYPLTLRRRGIHGRVEIKATLASNGDLESSAITKSSGFSELDDLALKAVTHAAPFPTKGMGRLTLSLPIEFKLSLPQSDS